MEQPCGSVVAAHKVIVVVNANNWPIRLRLVEQVM